MMSRKGAHWLASLPPKAGGDEGMTVVVHCEHTFRSDEEAGLAQSLSAPSLVAGFDSLSAPSAVAGFGASNWAR